MSIFKKRVESEYGYRMNLRTYSAGGSLASASVSAGRAGVMRPAPSRHRWRVDSVKNGHESLCLPPASCERLIGSRHLAVASFANILVSHSTPPALFTHVEGQQSPPSKSQNMLLLELSQMALPMRSFSHVMGAYLRGGAC